MGDTSNGRPRPRPRQRQRLVESMKRTGQTRIMVEGKWIREERIGIRMRKGHASQV